MGIGVGHRKIHETPVAIIDFETTGLAPGFDRVVEVSVVRIDPGEKPRLAFDSLVNPGRFMAATEIHGISDDDVRKAPRFHEIAGDVLEATNGCMIAAYNAYFDMRFLKFELTASGVTQEPPYFCLMYLRTMLQLGNKCRLGDACRAHGIVFEASHQAAADAMAAGELFLQYLKEIKRRGLSTYQDLAALKSYKFCESFTRTPFSGAANYGLRQSASRCSRATANLAPAPTRRVGIAAYWDALKTVLADLEVTDEEYDYIMAEREKHGLKIEEIRAMHARALTSVLTQFGADQWIDDREVQKLKKLYRCLASLGWAPGW